MVMPHPDPLYRVEGDPARKADGIYDTMRAVGADEIVIETPEHDRKLEDLNEDQILLVMEAWKQRIEDLKRDLRFKYVSVFKNYGAMAAQEGSPRAFGKCPLPLLCRGGFCMNFVRRATGTPRKSAAYLRHREAGSTAGKANRGHPGRICSVVSLRFSSAVRNLAAQSQAQLSVRTAAPRPRTGAIWRRC